MRVVFATRIFTPEVSAASAILRTWAEEFRDRGWEVTVLTTRPPRGATIDDPPGIDVRRAPVKRDAQQYVRGYLSYLSYDIPLAFRMLFSCRADLYVVEPPPTTVALVRAIGWLRRTPYVVRAADYWSDAARMVTGNRLVLGLLRRVEGWGLAGAAKLFAAHEPLVERLRDAGIESPALAIGFGADTSEFQYRHQATPEEPVFVYAGTHSEWHGAGIFVDALPAVLERHPDTHLVFYGNGGERDDLSARAHELGVADSVEFNGPIPPSELAPILAGATASVASVTPDERNEYAMATKVYSSFAAGCPVIFAGVGPTIDLLDSSAGVAAGVAVDYDIEAAAAAMNEAAQNPLPPEGRAELAEWTADQHSLTSIARRLVDECSGIIRR